MCLVILINSAGCTYLLLLLLLLLWIGKIVLKLNQLSSYHHLYPTANHKQ
jgi:hypothetical protein